MERRDRSRPPKGRHRKKLAAHKPRATGARSGSREDTDETANQTPLIINGWRIYLYAAFAQRYDATAAEIRRLRDADPDGYARAKAAKFARVLHDLVVREIPANPASPNYRLGNTLGVDARVWRRAKFFGRFRLSFRYSSEQRTIVYAWLNDESTLRKSGSTSDVYAVFRRLIERGTPPASWDALIAASTPATPESTQGGADD
jgi:toxin YhaV